jgi:hypothetical protein
VTLIEVTPESGVPAILDGLLRSPAPEENRGPRRILIAPCRDADVRIRFADPLAHAVPFTEVPVRDLLSSDDLQGLLRLHPVGRARFWGAIPRYDPDFDDRAAGDVVLFTGPGCVRAVGRIGHTLRNQPLADRLWVPDPWEGSWSNIYTVLDFRQVTGLTCKDILPRARRSPGALKRLPKPPNRRDAAGRDLLTPVAARVTRSGLAPAMEDVPVEDRHTERFMQASSGGPREAERAEAALVHRYQAHLAAMGVAVSRKRYRAGQARPMFCDLWVEERHALIEAKSSDARESLRMAIGQLYDYRRFHQPPVNLAVLLPVQPGPDGLSLLQSAGIEAIWPCGQGFRDSANGAFV